MLIGKAEPFLRKGIDQLSTAIRPKKKYKTNRKDLDGGGVAVSNLAYGFNYAPWTRPPKKRERSRHPQSNWKTPKTSKRMDTSWAQLHRALQPIGGSASL